MRLSGVCQLSVVSNNVDHHSYYSCCSWELQTLLTVCCNLHSVTRVMLKTAQREGFWSLFTVMRGAAGRWRDLLKLGDGRANQVGYPSQMVSLQECHETSATLTDGTKKWRDVLRIWRCLPRPRHAISCSVAQAHITTIIIPTTTSIYWALTLLRALQEWSHSILTNRLGGQYYDGPILQMRTQRPRGGNSWPIVTQ